MADCKNVTPQVCGVHLLKFPSVSCADAPHFEGITNITVNQGDDIDLTDGVHAYDGNGFEIPYEVSPDTLDPCASGQFTVKYTAVGSGEGMRPTFPDCVDTANHLPCEGAETEVTAYRTVTIRSIGQPTINIESDATVCDAVTCEDSVGCPMSVIANEPFDPLEGVVARDGLGNVLPVTYSGEGYLVSGDKIYYPTSGTYTLTYSAEDACGNRVTATVGVEVEELSCFTFEFYPIPQIEPSSTYDLRAVIKNICDTNFNYTKLCHPGIRTHELDTECEENTYAMVSGLTYYYLGHFTPTAEELAQGYKDIVFTLEGTTEDGITVTDSISYRYALAESGVIILDTIEDPWQHGSSETILATQADASEWLDISVDIREGDATAVANGTFTDYDGNEHTVTNASLHRDDTCGCLEHCVPFSTDDGVVFEVGGSSFGTGTDYIAVEDDDCEPAVSGHLEITWTRIQG